MCAGDAITAIAMANSRNPFVVPVFLPHAGCPHRCAFCNQHAVTGAATLPTISEFESSINRFLGYAAGRPSEIQIAFYGGNFLGLPDADAIALLSLAQRFVRDGRADSIRFSTRPDTIDEHRLQLISDYSVGTVELGVQSMNDEVLAVSHRGHTAAQTNRAARQLKEKGYAVGLQMMIGLPGDTLDRAIQTARRLADLEPDFVRVYPTVVLANSRLEILYREGRYRPLSIEDAVAMTKRVYLHFFRRSIPVVRIGLQASTELESGETMLAGPYHPAFGHLVHSALFLDMGRRLLAGRDICGQTVLFYTHPCSISKMKGLKRANIAILRREFALSSLTVAPDPDLPVDGLTLGDRRTVVTYGNLALNALPI